jgi:SH3 domain-containing YSC84-like protein 1
MNKISFVLMTSILALAVPGVSLRAGTKEDKEVQPAAAIMHRFKSMPEKNIPRRVMRDAKGLAILTVTKGGASGR